jgi:hypothetical protein
MANGRKSLFPPAFLRVSKKPWTSISPTTTCRTFQREACLPTRFGTGSERDLLHNRLLHYFQVVDRELTGFLNSAPLVLVGIAQSSVSKYPRLLGAKLTSPDHLAWYELIECGQDAVLEAQQGEAERVLGELRETARRDRVTSGV